MGNFFIMEREEQVCTLATAIRLKELGAPQNTHRKWFIVKDSILKGGSGYQKANLSNDLSNVPYSYCEKDKQTKDIKVYAAYDASEAGKLLPRRLPGEEWSQITIGKLDYLWECLYSKVMNVIGINVFLISFKHENLAEAMSRMLIYLYEKGYLKPAEK